MSWRRSNGVDRVHGGGRLMEEEPPLPVYDLSLQPTHVLALKNTRECVEQGGERIKMDLEGGCE